MACGARAPCGPGLAYWMDRWSGLSGEDPLLLVGGEVGRDGGVRRRGRVVAREELIESGGASGHRERLDLLALLEHDPVVDAYPREPGAACGDVGLHLDAVLLSLLGQCKERVVFGVGAQDRWGLTGLEVWRSEVLDGVVV